ncbi:glycosyl hydrolase family 95 catalytic domain-containing protein, partial [Sanguibacter suaedae]
AVEDDASGTGPTPPGPHLPGGGDVAGATARHRLPHGHRLVVVLAAGVAPGVGDDVAVDALLQDLHGRAARVAAEGSATGHARHAAAHRALYDRTELTLHEPAGEHGPDDAHETDRTGPSTAVSAALAFHFGRYVLVSGYHPDANPLSLQGLWNDELPAPWSSNYTLNINTEMNYSPAETANLAECHEPLLRWLTRAAQGPAREAARHLYGADGWVLHHNSDAWGHAATVGAGDGDVSWAWWPLGGVWLARHLWDHHEFSGDVAHLRDAWPVLASCARFVADWVVADPARGPGATRTVPSTSPENRYVAPDGAPAAATTSSTMDVALVRDLVLRVRQAADALGSAPDWLPALESAVAALPDPRVGPRGELLEWAEDLAEAEPEHRHTSHLVGVYPLGQIGPGTHPGLAAAARRTLELRGPESTGWALAWRLALWARLRDAEQAHETLGRCLRPALAADGEGGPAHRGGLYPNLFSAHPPFQIDGNLGLVAGIVEMLVQSHEGRIDLLPALPSAWPAGSVRGLRARHDVVVDVEWARGAPTRVRLVSARPRRTDLRWGDRTVTIDLAGTTPVVLGPDLEPRTAPEH